MRNKAKLALIAFLMAFAVPMVLSSGEASSDSGSQLLSTEITSADYLLADYKAWEAKYLENGGDRNVVMSMGYSKGLSTEKTNAAGQVTLNLIDGIVSVKAEGLSKGESWDFWLIDNGPGSSVTPDAEDAMVRVGSLKHRGNLAKLEANLGSEAFVNFDPDVYVVTRAGKNPAEERILVGTTTLYHRLYRSGQRGQFGQLADMDLPRAERLVPILRIVDPIVAKLPCARGHADAKRLGEAVQRALREPERLEARITDADLQPGRRRIPPIRRGGDMRR